MNDEQTPPGGGAVYPSTPSLPVLSDEEIIVEALRDYPGGMTWGTAMFHRHPDDNAELRRREERARQLAVERVEEPLRIGEPTEPAAGIFDVRLDYHSPDRMWACVVLRHVPVERRCHRTVPVGLGMWQRCVLATRHRGECSIDLPPKEPWYLDGAVVGLGVTPADALVDLLGVVGYLVEHGENFLTDGPISARDREWLRQWYDRAPLGVSVDPRPLDQIGTEDHGAGTP